MSEDGYVRGYDPGRDRRFVARLMADGGLPCIVQTARGPCFADPDGRPWRLRSGGAAGDAVAEQERPRPPRASKRGPPDMPPERLVRRGGWAERILLAVDRGNATVAGLVLATGAVHAYAVTKLLRRMFDLGLLERDPAPSGHGYLWRLSPLAREILTRMGSAGR